MDEFCNSMLKPPKNQTGNFCDLIDEVLFKPRCSFLHLVCRKIDIRKSLYTSYDEERDLLPANMEQLNTDYYLKIVCILAYFLLCGNSKGICYKALNSLLKLKKIMPEKCLENPFADKVYDKYVKDALI